MSFLANFTRWLPRRGCRGNEPVRRRPSRKVRLALETLEDRLMPSVNVLTYHNDFASTGLNAAEVQLTPANVKVGSFGKLYATTVDGQVYAQPLVDTGITIANGPNTSVTGTHDVVFVATEHDSLYAIDAARTGGEVLWKRSFTDITTPGYSANTPGTNINNTLGATAVGTVPSADVGTGDINPEIGITGTPVIDPATSTLYVVVKTRETIGGNAHYVQRLHAINISNGTDRVAPFLIGDTTGGNTNNTPIYVYGSGDGNLTDPYNGTGKPVVQLNALREHQRAALSLVNHTVYVAWASHGDNGPYHGWVVQWDVSQLASAGFQMTGVLCTSPNNGQAGIWQSGGRLVFEADGKAFFFTTGNGPGGQANPTLNASGFPANASYNESLVKVVADPTTGPTHQNANGWGLKVADYFTPYNLVALDNIDADFGSGAPLILPDSAGIPGHPHLMVASGKEGKIYLIDRDNLGKFDPTSDHVLNAVLNKTGNKTPPKLLNGALSTAAYYNGTLYWTDGYSGHTFAYAIHANGSVAATSQTAIASFGYLPGSVIVSSNGTRNGIVWVMDRAANRIHAYNAATLATELWNSGQKPGGGDNVGAVVKFAVPAEANGEVFVGTSNSLVVYGLTPPANAVPRTPALAATALSGSSINLTWTDSTRLPNTANGYTIQESTDGRTFRTITTAPAGATALAVGGLRPLTRYFFRIRGFNAVGTSTFSNVARATTTSPVASLDFSGGFVGAASTLTLNGSARINRTNLELTQDGAVVAGSAFSTKPVDVRKFTTQFTFQVTSAGPAGEGFTFAIQRAGPTAVGHGGSGLGYGPDLPGSVGINHSVAVKFDLFNDNGEGFDSTGLYTNGAHPTNVGSIDLTPTGIDLHSGDVFQVNMSYDGATLAVTIQDTQTGQSATQNYPINIPGTVGNTTAYVGFTGGTGGLTATQDILTWTYAPSTAAPNAPSGLGAVPASASSVTLSWTNNAVNQAGYHLDRATDPGFTQNLITENVPAKLTRFTDTATGLAPGGTFYYRLRAFNGAGDSGSSNVASVTIPLAPPKPTNQQVTNVTTTEIDLSWQDNAGHQADGYYILRAANHGSFTQVASLPASGKTPPSTYTWADTGLTPGTFYEYHILAFNVSGNNDFAGTNATTLTAAPSGLTAPAGNAVVNLSWTAPVGAVSYNVYRGTAAGAETLLGHVTTTTYADTSVTNGTTYFYFVTALNGNASPLPGESALSNEIAATPA
jgi:hypothetical protein